MISILNDFLNIIYPSCCISCEKPLVTTEEVICIHCLSELIPTDFHLHQDNIIAKKFYGKVNLKMAVACFPFVKQGKSQKILHNLKYRNEEKLSEIMGLWYGKYIKSGITGAHFDLVVPVPLHPKKLVSRGYNQSEGFAKGLAKIFNTEWNNNTLIRKTETSTQTKKTRLQRWYNVKGIFGVTDVLEVENKDILLVDDVVTTGATLEACAKVLYSANANSVSIATIAYA